MGSQREGINRSWFSNRLKHLGRSQSDLAHHLELDRSAVTHMLKGTRKMDQYEILGTARFLSANPADVVLAACGEKVVNDATSHQPAPIPKTPISEPLAVREIGDGQASLHVDMTIPWSLALDILRLLNGRLRVDDNSSGSSRTHRQHQAGALRAMTQCDRIFARFGGVPKLCSALGAVGKERDISTVYRWNLARPQGSGGVIPATSVDDVMAAADRAGVKLTDQDWNPRKS